MKILVVDDELDICEILQYNLENEGYEVVTANSAEEALKLPLQEFALILLDVMMGEMSGFQMARKMKDNPSTAQIPIIFITALEGEDNLVKGLAVLRRATQTNVPPSGEVHVAVSDSKICFEGISLDLNAKTATVDGQDIFLTKLEYEMLSLLLQHPGKVFSREDILTLCWPQDVFVLDRTVDVNITRLRKKIGSYGKQIKTRVGYGYCFEK